jgi:four helix bundle protein
MKLEVWQKAIALYNLVWGIMIDAKIDFKFRAQAADAAQSVASNIAEGYSRRSINGYMQHLYVSLGSLSEVLTRLIGFRETRQITPDQFEQVDILHYKVENKLWNLVKSLENKKSEGTWIDRISEESPEYEV